MQYIRLLERAGLAKKTKGGKWYDLHLHTLRKYFRTRCSVAGISASFYQHWMGHKGGKDSETYMDDAYFKAALQEHVKEYRKVIPHLTLKTVTAKQQEDLRKEVEALKLKLKNRDLETDMLNQEVELLEKIVKESLPMLPKLQSQTATVQSQLENVFNMFADFAEEMDPSLKEYAKRLRQPSETSKETEKRSEEVKNYVTDILKDLEKLKQIKKQIPK